MPLMIVAPVKSITAVGATLSIWSESGTQGAVSSSATQILAPKPKVPSSP